MGCPRPGPVSVRRTVSGGRGPACGDAPAPIDVRIDDSIPFPDDTVEFLDEWPLEDDDSGPQWTSPFGFDELVGAAVQAGCEQ